MRCVACVQFVVKDKVPASVTQFRFTYSGGSTSYDLMKQSGSRSSTLVALFDVADSARRDSSVYAFYAIPLKRQRTLERFQFNPMSLRDLVDAFLQQLFNFFVAFLGD